MSDGSANSFLTQAGGVIHVGANIGQERDFYQKLGLRVLWIEPIQEVFAQLVGNIAGYVKQKAICALVTDRDDVEYDFNLANNDGGSSSIFQFGQHPEIWPEVHYLGSRKLRSTTLATLFHRVGLTPSMYPALVMDVQGAELLVLKGAGDLLNGVVFIQAEVADFEVYVGCAKLADLTAFLEPQGFQEIIRAPFAARKGGGTCWDVVWRRVDTC
jgi:FkbM family methyltransferase